MNPAEHEARNDAARCGDVVGSPEERTEDYLLGLTAGEDDGGVGAWLLDGERPLWGRDV